MRENAPVAVRELIRATAVDVVYLVRLDADTRISGDGYCRVRGLVQGEGYDSQGRLLAAGLDTTIRAANVNCENALGKFTTLVGDTVRRIPRRLGRTSPYLERSLA